MTYKKGDVFPNKKESWKDGWMVHELKPYISTKLHRRENHKRVRKAARRILHRYEGERDGMV